MSDSEKPWEIVLRPRFFDASAILKMVLVEPGSHKVSACLAECQGSADTSWLSIAEAFGVLKDRWRQRGTARSISEETYQSATTQLLIAIQCGQLRAVDVADDRRGSITLMGAHPAGGKLIVYLPDAIELRRKYPHLDVADVIQFRAIKEGFRQYLAGESEPRLVSADEALLKAAAAEGIATVDVRND
jgi:predicted nucleic acid-binding protein